MRSPSYVRFLGCREFDDEVWVLVSYGIGRENPQRLCRAAEREREGVREREAKYEPNGHTNTPTHMIGWKVILQLLL